MWVPVSKIIIKYKDLEVVGNYTRYKENIDWNGDIIDVIPEELIKANLVEKVGNRYHLLGCCSKDNIMINPNLTFGLKDKYLGALLKLALNKNIYTDLLEGDLYKPFKEFITEEEFTDIIQKLLKNKFLITDGDSYSLIESMFYKRRF